MIYSFINAFNLFGSSGTATTGAEGGAAAGSPFSPIILMGILFVAMYFLTIRPQKKKQKEEQNMRDSIQIGDEITTIGGIMGRVITVKDDSIVIETGADRTKLKFQRWAIQTNNTANDRMAAERKAAEDAKKAKSEKDAINEKVNGRKSKKTIEVKNDDVPEESVNDIPEEK